MRLFIKSIYFIRGAKRVFCNWNYRMSVAKYFIRALSTQNIRVISREVQQALATGQPVVALESTVITHGMPHPSNLHMANELEDIVRRNGAIPATIGIIDGQVHIGLEKHGIEKLADPNVKHYKVSRRDLSYVLSQGYSGGTTVSATMLCAHQAGIRVFVTGGIGGVHRDGQNSMDVSADLTELGRTPVAVVCAGVKSILDIGRTLELLETNGVTVATLGNNDDFPAFFTPTSGYKSPCHVTSIQDCAALINANITANIDSGIIIAVPIPQHVAPLSEEINEAILLSLQEAKGQNISGKDITPYVLQRINEITKGKSLEANISLIKNNADVGSQIAVCLAEMNKGTTSNNYSISMKELCEKDGRGSTSHSQPVVIGGAIIDYVAKITRQNIMSEGTNPGQIKTSFGGVARNIAECLTRVGMDPFFISAVGQDFYATQLKENFNQMGMTTKGLLEFPDFSTATYCLVLDHAGEMYCAIGDTDIIKRIEPHNILQFTDHLKNAPLVCIDGNLRLDTLKFICQFCKEHTIPLWFEPTCMEKALKPWQAAVLDFVTYSSPNLVELRSMYHSITSNTVPSSSTLDATLDEKLEECFHYCPVLLENVPTIFVSLGKDGVLVGRRDINEITMKHYPAAPDHLLPVSVANASGAGDSFAGAVMAGIVRGHSLDHSVRAGLKASYLSLLSSNTIADNISHDELFTSNALHDWMNIEPTIF